MQQDCYLIFSRKKKFFWPQTPTDWKWAPPSDLFSGCRAVYTGGSATGEWRWPQDHRLLPSLRMSTAITALPPYTSLSCVSTSFGIPNTGLDRPWSFQEFEAPRFQGSRHMKVVRWPVLRTCRLYPPGIISGTHFCLRHCATSGNFAGSIPDGVIGIFHWHNPSGRTMALRLTQPLTEMSTRNIFWG
jgi:hypothetical protein